MNYKIQPTPAVALGSYEITPLEAIGAYTVFANQGDYVKPNFISLVRSQDGKVVYRNQPEHKQVLDPRVAYLMTNLMEEVLRSGTAAGVRAARLQRPGGRQDRHFARRLVRRLHLRTVVRGVGGVRRQQRARPGRRALGRAHLDRVHEARARTTASIATPNHSRRRMALSPSISIRNPGCPPRPTARSSGRRFTSWARSPWAPARCTAAAGQARPMWPDGKRPHPPSRLRRRTIPRAPPDRKEKCRRPPWRAAPRGRTGSECRHRPIAATAQQPKKEEKRGFFRRLLGVFK